MSKCFDCQHVIIAGLLCDSCEQEKIESERWVIDQDVFHAEDDSRRLQAMSASEALNMGETQVDIDTNATEDVVYDAAAPRPGDQDWLSSNIEDVASGSFDIAAFVKDFSEAQALESSDRLPLNL